ncbi:DUF3144 domain-containing protein [Aestuariirhabdus litorea]|uniref:DUF3144 domain-containing protein n=1 Tax=Aestuariirhabdus litorea TaxID=2528527 RepID=A0A3P3VR00_9GAMM|nr:DUF3144 domain-containing protein [Aestuariirhabdus litorea]RRJ84096.1 DUF3144 domain-containing protein [Aestuariirhabdus litorea]RWW97316.1 DUF3144 domain-containing protein [Endozoicomonadaceae bacterium GTF-13]
MPSETEKQKIYEMADQFIDVANRLAAEPGQDLALVGAAIRYAAARFNAHEASLQTDDLAAEQMEVLSWFTDQYQKMLIDNIDQHIEIQKSRRSKVVN